MPSTRRKVTGGDAAMKEVPGLVVGLTPPDDELVLLQGHLELVLGKSSDSQGDAQTLGSVLGTGQTLDIVGRVTVSGCFRDAVERLLDLVEAQEKRMPERRLTRHGRSPRFRGTSVSL